MKMNKTIQERFETFHSNNPKVYDKLVELSRQAKAKGFSHYGIRTIWELMRWHFEVVEQQDGLYYLNDHFHSRYARKIMENEHDLDGFFHIRRLTA